MSYEKEMMKSMQNTADRVLKQQTQPTNGGTAVGIPKVPGAHETVKCQFCGNTVPPTYPNAHQKISDSCRKFAVCIKCRDTVLGVGGILDRQTHGLERDRKLK